MRRAFLIVTIFSVWVLTRANTYEVTSPAGVGSGTLHEAITNANSNLNPDTIIFSVKGKIDLSGSSPLPAITDTLVIDASSQWSGNIPGDTIDGASIHPIGLRISYTNHCVIRGLVIQGFGEGIQIENGSGNIIGGRDSLKNIISSNLSVGVYILYNSNQNKISGNYIGTDATGDTATPNGVGVWIAGGTGNEIGDSLPGEGNIISGNTVAGIRVTGNTLYNIIMGNYIGTKSDGRSDLGNSGPGIELLNGTTDNKIDSNTIAFNRKGLVIKDNETDYNKITKNSIFDNDDLGIDLGDDGPGITAGNPNEAIDFPVIELAKPDTIKGTGPPYSFIEIFRGGADPTDYGEGEEFVALGVTDVSGNFTISGTGWGVGDTITATATDADGNTSEFSKTERVEEYQSDNWIATVLAPTPDWIGDNIINTDGALQTKTQEILSDDSAIYYIKIENDGSAPDSFKVEGTMEKFGWSVTYYDSTEAGKDITSDMIGPGWYTKPLKPLSSKEIRVVVNPGNTDSLPLFILSASTADPIKEDAVKAITYVRRIQPDNQIAIKADGSDYLGDNIYNLDGTDQTKIDSIKYNESSIFYIKTENDGNIVDTFFVKGDSGSEGWSVTYYSEKTDGIDITDSIIAGIWKILPSDSISLSKEIRVEIKLDTPTPAEMEKDILITSTSFTDTTKKDAVKASIRVIKGVEEVYSEREFRFWIGFPNPSNRKITINYEMPTSSSISLKIYDVTGRVIEDFFSERQNPGLYHKVWRSRTAGVYFCYLKGEGFTALRKIVILK